jgi:hypothetical protein
MRVPHVDIHGEPVASPRLASLSMALIRAGPMPAVLSTQPIAASITPLESTPCILSSRIADTTSRRIIVVASSVVAHPRPRVVCFIAEELPR